MNKNINTLQFTCIIPFYNEGQQLLTVIETLKKVNGIKQFICVDDGSTDNVAESIKKRFPEIIVLQNKQNQGKSTAVFKALPVAKYEDLLLMDADWLKLKADEIELALEKYKDDNTIDMLILKFTGNNSFIDELLRKYIFLSGNRIIRKRDLLEIAKRDPHDYQLEVAINQYMMEKNKKVLWTHTTAFNPHKTKKMGFIRGMGKDLQMEWDIVLYIGLRNYLKQMVSFCRTELSALDNQK